MTELSEQFDYEREVGDAIRHGLQIKMADPAVLEAVLTPSWQAIRRHLGEASRAAPGTVTTDFIGLVGVNLLIQCVRTAMAGMEWTAKEDGTPDQETVAHAQSDLVEGVLTKVIIEMSHLLPGVTVKFATERAMSDGTHIEWTNATWNPLRARVTRSMAHPLPGVTARPGWACVRVSAGCTHCYAATINHRLGTGLDYTVPAMVAVETYLDEAALVKPLSWRKPRKVFVCSMTDLFGEWVTDEQIDRVFAVMKVMEQHEFQVLTKRTERMRDYFAGGALARIYGCEGCGDTWAHRPLPNVWLGTSVEDQATADERIPELLECPAAVRFLSVEPLLGPVDLTATHKVYSHYDRSSLTAFDPCWLDGDTRIDWVIVGGESGPGARPMDIAWVRSIVSQCQAAAVPMFVKQLGAKPYVSDLSGRAAPIEVDRSWLTVGGRTTVHYKLKSRKGNNPEEWPVDLRVREFPPEVQA